MQYSANVLNAQKRLQRLGYYNGRLDGLWGPETRGAVERFQREEGILVTAQLDGRTIDALNDAGVPSHERALTAAPSPAHADPARLVISDADDIRAIQVRLRDLVYYDGPGDGPRPQRPARKRAARLRPPTRRSAKT